jgi:integrase
MRIKSAFTIHARPDRETWELTLNPACGLPAGICRAWRRRSFKAIPAEILTRFPTPKSRQMAKRIVWALLEHLRKRQALPTTAGTKCEAWFRLFLLAETSPRAERLLAKGQPYSPGTLYNYASIINAHILTDKTFIVGMIEQTEPEDIQAYLARLAKKIGAANALEQVYKVIRMMFREFKLRHRGYDDPFIYVEKPVVKKEKRGSLEDAEVLKIFSKAGVFKTPLERAVFTAAFWAGLRRGEIFALQWEDVDVDRKVIHVRRAWKKFSLTSREEGDPKWHKTRDVPLPDLLVDALAALQAAYGKHEYVMSHPDGRVPSANWWRSRSKAVLERAGIKIDGRKITPHSARHSLASLLYQRGVQLKYIQDLLGQSDLEVTQLYIHTPAGEINRIAKEIGKVKATGGEKKRKPAAAVGDQ